MHLTEHNASLFDTNAAIQLYAEWRRYWNVSKEVLLEKSPRHALMTRLLQHWFGAEHTLCLVILRHPFGTMTRELWDRSERVASRHCNEDALRHWLHVHDVMFEDLKHTRNKMVLHFESFVLGDTQGKLMNFVFDT